MYKNGVTSGIHYLDDLLFCGAPGSGECAGNLAKALEICSELGVPVARHKLEGPTTSNSINNSNYLFAPQRHSFINAHSPSSM